MKNKLIDAFSSVTGHIISTTTNMEPSAATVAIKGAIQSTESWLKTDALADTTSTIAGIGSSFFGLSSAQDGAMIDRGIQVQTKSFNNKR